MPTPTLTPAQRRRLHAALSRLPSCATPEGRTRLLHGFPADTRERFPPALSRQVDLDHIIDAAHAWGLLPDGTAAVQRLIENGLEVGGDPRAGDELAALLQEVLAPAPAAEPGEWRALLRQARKTTAPEEAAALRAQAWRAVPLPLPRELMNEWGAVRAVALTPEGRHAISGGDDTMVRVWTLGDLAKGETPGRILTGHGWWVRAVATTPDGRYVLSGAWDKTLLLWDLTTGQIVRRFTGHTEPVLAVAVTPDGRHALSGGDEAMLILWDLTTGQPVRTLTGHTRPVKALAVSPDGRQALSASMDRTLRLWDLDSGATLRTLAGHTWWVNTVAFTADGRQALSSSTNEPLRLWDLTTGETVRTVGGKEAVYTLAISPNGQYVLAGCEDGQVRLWDLAAPADQLGADSEICTLPAHPGGVDTLAVSADGGTVVTGGRDGAVRLWTFPPGLLG